MPSRSNVFVLFKLVMCAIMVTAFIGNTYFTIKISLDESGQFESSRSNLYKVHSNNNANKMTNGLNFSNVYLRNTRRSHSESVLSRNKRNSRFKREYQRIEDANEDDNDDDEDDKQNDESDENTDDNDNRGRTYEDDEEDDVDENSPVVHKYNRERKKYKKTRLKMKNKLIELDKQEKAIKKSLNCHKTPCLNGGTCVSTPPHGYRCFCKSHYGGDNCEMEFRKRKSKNKKTRLPVRVKGDKIVVKVPKMIVIAAAVFNGIALCVIAIFCCAVKFRMERVRAPYRESLSRGEALTSLPPGFCQSCGWVCKTIFCCRCCSRDAENPFGQATLREPTDELALLLPQPETINRRVVSDVVQPKRSALHRTVTPVPSASRSQQRVKSYHSGPIVASKIDSPQNLSANRRVSDTNARKSRDRCPRSKRMRSASVCNVRRYGNNRNENNETESKYQRRSRADVIDAYDLECKDKRKISYIVDSHDDNTVHKVVEYLKRVNPVESVSSSLDTETPRSPHKCDQRRYSKNNNQSRKTDFEARNRRFAMLNNDNSSSVNGCELHDRARPGYNYSQNSTQHKPPVASHRTSAATVYQSNIPFHHKGMYLGPNASFQSIHRNHVEAQTRMLHNDVANPPVLYNNPNVPNTVANTVTNPQMVQHRESVNTPHMEVMYNQSNTNTVTPATGDMFVNTPYTPQYQYQTVQQNYQPILANQNYPPPTEIPYQAPFCSPPRQFSNQY